MCYVAEVTSGKVAAYAIPWSPPMYAASQMQNGRWYWSAADAASAKPEPGPWRARHRASGREREKEQ